jgi:eukaryotic-like serine/threonine-protein kinase
MCIYPAVCASAQLPGVPGHGKQRGEGKADMPDWSVPGYEAIKALGAGGFGDVVLARHEQTGALVAIKYLRPELLADPLFAGMFRDEAQVLGTMDDPNVVRLYEYVESAAGAAIVMELVDGVSLRDILVAQGATTPEAALVVLQGSLLGLAIAHRRGVVHRDYKPENILVAGDGVSKLTDFGLAARTGDRPVPAGTLLYVAPEQIAGGAATPASDVYSATATFYECLTGVPPFGGEAAELLRAHRSEPVPLDPVPPPLRPLVAAGMAKDPARRPADAMMLVGALGAAAAGAYGPDWEERGRSRLGEAAVALAALWPLAAPPAAQGLTVHRVFLGRQLTPLKAVIVLGAVVAVAAIGTVTAVAATGHDTRPPVTHAAPPPTHSVSLQPSPSTSGTTPAPSTSLTPSTKPPGTPSGPPASVTPSAPPNSLTPTPPPKSPPPTSPPPKSPPPKSPPPTSAPPTTAPPTTAPPTTAPPTTAPPTTAPPPPTTSPPPIQQPTSPPPIEAPHTSR